MTVRGHACGRSSGLLHQRCVAFSAKQPSFAALQINIIYVTFCFYMPAGRDTQYTVREVPFINGIAQIVNWDEKPGEKHCTCYCGCEERNIRAVVADMMAHETIMGRLDIVDELRKRGHTPLSEGKEMPTGDIAAEIVRIYRGV